MPAAVVDVGAAAVRLHGEAGPGHEAFEGLVGGGGPVDDAATGAEGGPGGVETGEDVEAAIAVNGESGGAVIDIEHDSVEAAGGFADDFGDVFLREDDAAVLESLGGQGVGRVSVPGDDGGEDFGLDDLGVGGEGREGGFEGKAEAETSDEHAGTGFGAESGAGQFGENVLGIVLAGGHEFRPADCDAVVSVVFSELEVATVGGLGGIEENVFFQGVSGQVPA